jgi:hypothetical protein
MRSTPALWLALGIPVLVAGLVLIVWSTENFNAQSLDERWNMSFGILHSLWASMALPMGGAILIGLLWGLEHNSGHLKHMLALPASRSHVFWAKQLSHVLLLLLGTLVLEACLLLAANLADMTSVRSAVLVRLPLMALLGSLPALTLVSWLAQRKVNFVLPMGLGVVGMIVGLLASNSQEFWRDVPWSWGLIAAGGNPEALNLVVGLSLGTTLIFSCLAWLHFLRSDAPC